MNVHEYIEKNAGIRRFFRSITGKESASASQKTNEVLRLKNQAFRDRFNTEKRLKSLKIRSPKERELASKLQRERFSLSFAMSDKRKHKEGLRQIDAGMDPEEVRKNTMTILDSNPYRGSMKREDLIQQLETIEDIRKKNMSEVRDAALKLKPVRDKRLKEIKDTEQRLKKSQEQEDILSKQYEKSLREEDTALNQQNRDRLALGVGGAGAIGLGLLAKKLLTKKKKLPKALAKSKKYSMLNPYTIGTAGIGATLLASSPRSKNNK